jgi:hypothetical protein
MDVPRPALRLAQPLGARRRVLLALGAAFLVERERQLHRIELERDRASAIARFTGDLFDSAGSLRTTQRGERARTRSRRRRPAKAQRPS